MIPKDNSSRKDSKDSVQPILIIAKVTVYTAAAIIITGILLRATAWTMNGYNQVDKAMRNK